MFWQSDKIPYIITVFVAAAAWAVVHTVDRLVDSPAIEYEITKKPVENVSDTWELRASITNLSKQTTFREINFLFRVPKDSKGIVFLAKPQDVVFTRIETHPPALEGSLDPPRKNVEVDSNGASYILPVLAPGNRYDLVTRYRGVGEPVFQGMPNLKADDSFALVSESYFTWVAKNELKFLWITIGGWLVLMLLYGLFRRNKSGSIGAT